MHRKKLGIIGGMGSRAGVFFLRKIIDYSPAETDQEFPEIIFHNNSLIPDRTRAIVYHERSPLEEIYKSIDMFNENDVEVIALACVTSYYYYNHVKDRTCARVINPLHLVAEYVRSSYEGVARVGVLATTGTIRMGLFHKALKDCGANVITLDPHDQEALFMESVYGRNGFKSAYISDEARGLMNEARERLTAKGVDLIIGGCTEVSIAISPDEITTPYIDTLDLMARKTVEYCYDIVEEKI